VKNRSIKRLKSLIDFAPLLFFSWPFVMRFTSRTSHTIPRRFLGIAIQPIVLAGLFLVVGVMVVGTGSQQAEAQGGNAGRFGTLGGVEPTGRYPSQQYYLAMEVYRSGDLEQAVELFERVSTRRDINGRWIDSIPVLAMRAECYWHLGHMPEVHATLDEVFQIAIRYRGWLGRVDWAAAIQPGVQRSPRPGLWPAAAAVKRLPVADKIQFGSGGLVTAQTIRGGGPIEELTVRTMDVVEIMRGLAIASYRRRILLGPLAAEDRLASQLLEATKYPAGARLPITDTLIGSMRATERFTYHDDKQTIAEASQRSTLEGGVHPLSPIAMLALASAQAGGKEPAAALPVAANVAHSAAALDQPEWVGEAMQLAAGLATTPEQAEDVRQAATAAATSLNRSSRLGTLHCLIAAADAAVSAGNLGAASISLDQARTLSARRDVMQPRIDAYGAYVAARLAAANGESIGMNSASGVDNALNLLSTFALNRRDRNRPVVSMPRIYQFALVRAAAGSTLGGKSSDFWLKAYCDDPPADVWRRDAVDALASVMVDRTDAHIARVHLAAAQTYGEEVLQKADELLASRFYQRLPVGGRIMQVRMTARTDEALLDTVSVEFRKNAGRAMMQLRQDAMAMDAPDPAAAARLEAAACAIALSRLHIPRSFPRPLDEKLPLAKLPPRTGLLMFVSAGNKTYATLSAEGKTILWTIGGAARLPSELGRVLRGIGVGKPRGNRLPEDDSWRADAVTLRQHLLPDDAAITAQRFDEIVVVPDGPLWYLPLEMLPIAGEESPLIGDSIRVRYAATPGLALHPVSPPPSSRAIGLVADRFFAPAEPELNETITQSILDVVGEPVRLPGTPATSTGMLGDSLGHLVVAAPRAANAKSPLMMSIAPYDQGNPAGTVAGWIRFPAQIPRSVVLAGFRTPVDGGQMGNGDEIFMTLCGLNAAGVRSVLLSRWAVGGESTAIALREFVQELPFAGMNESWQRATKVLRRTELDPTGEPLLTQADHKVEGLTGNQPLFWAGYMVSSPPHATQP
jgi:hypothetical protein